ncbi:isochorismatase family cysteine hydrolase [Rhodococcus sp. X156]|uniref:cysteine hydrolase family protein n=1 Tax=Rhodococcus sp. X156 TaxID=2499145 RepID=UPI000FDBC32E|nr:isochorismatase family cysteine hydrolase [Rhodococcus sp. X156]
MTLPGPAAHGALLVIDVQRDFADPAHLGWVDEDGLAAVATAVQRTGELVDAFRAAGVPVVWVRLEQTPDQPWESSRWLRGLTADTPWPAEEPCVQGSAGVEWFELSPAPGETVVSKRGYSAFLGTELDQVLRDAGVQWLCTAGLTTECCVLASTLDAAQLGYRVLVAADAVASYTAAEHGAALGILAAHAARLTSSTELRHALGDGLTRAVAS